jgi:hypothetical protein
MPKRIPCAIGLQACRSGPRRHSLSEVGYALALMSLVFEIGGLRPGNAGGLRRRFFWVVAHVKEKSKQKERTGGEDRRRYQDPAAGQYCRKSPLWKNEWHCALACPPVL